MHVIYYENAKNTFCQTYFSIDEKEEKMSEIEIQLNRINYQNRVLDKLLKHSLSDQKFSDIKFLERTKEEKSTSIFKNLKMYLKKFAKNEKVSQTFEKIRSFCNKKITLPSSETKQLPR